LLRRLKFKDSGLQYIRSQRLPKFRLCSHPVKCQRKLWIEPSAGPVLDFELGRLDAICRLEYVNDLRDQSNAGVDRDLLATQFLRHAAAVPVLVEAADSVDDGLRKAHLARDFGATVATRFHQLLSDLSPILENVDKGAKAFSKPGIHAGVREHKPQHLWQAAIDRHEIAFECDVVGHIELTNARGVAAAADVLHQQGVIELPDLGLRKSELTRNVDSDPATADTMTRWLTVHHIERMSECTKQLGEPQPWLLHGLILGRCHCDDLRQ